jgi:uroporphyrin-III C-methyltransferase/precorrin-2 dehydrogenase/sirohydrochlorin ferrochelatase
MLRVALTRRVSTAHYYPVSLDLRGRVAVVIGGGPLAESKVSGLRDAGARVTVIARAPTRRLEQLALEGAISLHRREYLDGDLDGAHLAIAALETAEERRLHSGLWREAEQRRVLLNAVDDAQYCHFIAPAIHRQGSVTVAISTGGASPALAVRLRNAIARRVGPEYGELASLLAELRPDVAEAVPDHGTRAQLWHEIVASSAVRRRLRRGDRQGARARIAALTAKAIENRSNGSPSTSTPNAHLEPPRRRGMVYLVGGGPGAAGLITVTGLRALQRADVVVYDRLVNPALVAQVPAAARRIYVGKRAGDGNDRRQEAINRLLVRLAGRGRRVVRLKGGDPFVFGRGGEEYAALRAANVRVRVIPGVSAAIAAPAAAGVPVTRRGTASAFAVVAGRGENGADPNVDWAAVARMPTIVVLMGLASVRQVACRLLAHGLSFNTPAAVIANATLPEQRAVVGTLGTITALVAEAELTSPATLVVGDVVRSIQEAT